MPRGCRQWKGDNGASRRGGGASHGVVMID